MRFVFNTTYSQDFGLFDHSFQRSCFIVLFVLLLIAPFGLTLQEHLDRTFSAAFYIGELSELFIWSIAGAGMMLLVGYTGLVSLGHCAFLALGAYTHAVLYKNGIPLPIAMLAAVALSGIIGLIVGGMALRMTGIYLAIATLAFAFIVEKFIGTAGPITGGHRGMLVPEPALFGIDLSPGSAPILYYFLAFLTLLIVLWFLNNILRSPTGRAFIAVRDSEISAQAMSVDLVRYKTLAFALSAAFTGLAGALYSHKIGFLFPESFNVIHSIKLLMLVVVGGLGSIHGIVFGAAFVVLIPQVIAFIRDASTFLRDLQGLEPFVFGSILVLFLMFEPLGIYGRWVKIRLYFNQFPLYRKATFKRQRSFLRTERVH